MTNFNFNIEKKIPGKLGRAGIIHTPHGDIQTPSFVVVGTKATVKALTPEQVKDLGAPVVLANTYHLYLEPGDELVAKAGGLHKFMNWPGPMMTDSGGFQVFSLGAAFEEGGISKFLLATPKLGEGGKEVSTRKGNAEKLAKIDDEGVTFRSHIDGSEHRLTPERSMEIQYNLGADIIFAFDECTAPTADHAYQKEAMDRTHAWAKRSLARHNELDKENVQALFGIVQGGRHQDLREESAKEIGAMSFDGFGIGGSFEKKDMESALIWVNSILPEEKPRHLLGIGAVEDLFAGVENGADTFDCVMPTREARNGSLYTKEGRINIRNAEYRSDLASIEAGCGCYTCQNFSRAYVAHLFRAQEILASTLASIHNEYFFVNLVKQMREAILAGKFAELKAEYLAVYARE